MVSPTQLRQEGLALFQSVTPVGGASSRFRLQAPSGVPVDDLVVDREFENRAQVQYQFRKQGFACPRVNVLVHESLQFGVFQICNRMSAKLCDQVILDELL